MRKRKKRKKIELKCEKIFKSCDKYIYKVCSLIFFYNYLYLWTVRLLRKGLMMRLGRFTGSIF